MGSNKELKHKVAEGNLCYICERNPPTFTDDVGGHICKDCYAAIQAMRLVYTLQDGYNTRQMDDRGVS